MNNDIKEEEEKEIIQNYKKNIKGLFEPLLKTMFDSKDPKDINSFYNIFNNQNNNQENEENKKIKNKDNIIINKRTFILTNLLQTIEIQPELISEKFYIKIIQLSLSYLNEWGAEKNKDLLKEITYLKNYLEKNYKEYVEDNNKIDKNSNIYNFKYKLKILDFLEKSKFKYELFQMNKHELEKNFKCDKLNNFIEITNKNNPEVIELNKRAINLIN